MSIIFMSIFVWHSFIRLFINTMWTNTIHIIIIFYLCIFFIVQLVYLDFRSMQSSRKNNIIIIIICFLPRFSSGFPGAQPVSMDCKNISLLHEKPFKVSWKADGTRSASGIRQHSMCSFLSYNVVDLLHRWLYTVGFVLQLNDHRISSQRHKNM